jgi:hypothetical protein
VRKGVPVLKKDWKNPRMNNENYEWALEMKASDSLMMSSAMSVTDATSANCEIGASYANDVAQAYSITTLRLTSTSI